MGISIIYCVECQRKEMYQCNSLGKHKKYLKEEKGWITKRGFMTCPVCKDIKKQKLK